MNKSMQIALLITLLAAAAGAFAWWQWLNRQPVEPDEAAAFAEQAEASQLTLQQSLEERLIGRPQGEIAERLDSPMGQALLRACSEWTDLNDSHPSAANEENRDRACDDFRRYVDEGVAPE